MKVLEEITIEGKVYICTQKLSIKGNLIYVCKEKNTKNTIFLKENKNTGELEQTNDKNIKKGVEKLIYVKSPDYRNN